MRYFTSLIHFLLAMCMGRKTPVWPEARLSLARPCLKLTTVQPSPTQPMAYKWCHRWHWHYCCVLLVMGKFHNWISVTRFHSCAVNLHYTISLTVARQSYIVSHNDRTKCGIFSSYAVCGLSQPGPARGPGWPSFYQPAAHLYFLSSSPASKHWCQPGNIADWTSCCLHWLPRKEMPMPLNASCPASYYYCDLPGHSLRFHLYSVTLNKLRLLLVSLLPLLFLLSSFLLLFVAMSVTIGSSYCFYCHLSVCISVCWW